MDVKTSCESCVFARYDADQAQVGCAAGRLDLFRRQGAAITREHGAESGKAYFLVGRACNMNRPAGSEWERDAPQEEWVSKARAEVALKAHAVVYAPKGSDTDAVLKTVRSLANQSPNPAVTVVVTANQPRPGQLIPLLTKEFGSGLAWNVKLLTERARDGTPVPRGRAVDAVVAELRPQDVQYYLAVDAGAECPPGLLAELDAALNDRLERFLLLIRSEECPGVGPVVQVRLHHSLGGNAEAECDLPGGGTVRTDSLEEKVSVFVPETGGLVRTVGEFCGKRD